MFFKYKAYMVYVPGRNTRFYTLRWNNDADEQLSFRFNII